MPSSKEERVQQFREAFDKLPEEFKIREVDRVYCLAHGKKIIILEDHDIGKILKFLDVSNLREYLVQNKHVKADRSFIYKVLRGQYKSCYGYTIYYEGEN